VVSYTIVGAEGSSGIRDSGSFRLTGKRSLGCKVATEGRGGQLLGRKKCEILPGRKGEQVTTVREGGQRVFGEVDRKGIGGDLDEKRPKANETCPGKSDEAKTEEGYYHPEIEDKRAPRRKQKNEEKRDVHCGSKKMRSGLQTGSSWAEARRLTRVIRD